MEEYKYEPLDLERAAIRLLRLHCGLVNQISCELFQAELHHRQDSVSYEALSYTWGPPNVTESILVNGYRMEITHNLHEALLHLRREDEDRTLWVDAVCIDQANLKERGHQVAQMGEIYGEADRVIFRLGPSTYETDIFMKSLQFLQQASIEHACLKAIFNRSWFRRVWILQEAAFAKAGIISCGTKSVSARLFGLAPRLLGITPDKHCQSVLDIMPSPWRDTSSWNQNRTLYALLKAFGASEATDKRDLVYALRAMSSDFGDTNDLVPDYEKSEADVVRDVFRAIYCCELECLESSLRPRSLPELIRGLQSMDGDEHLRSLLKCPPTCDIMEEVFKNRRYIPVNQDILATAAQHDDTGKIVELLLRYRGEELQIDEETFVYAAANLYGAKEVLSVLSCHNSQVIVPEQALVAAAENRHCGDVAMDFLLSLKTKDYDIAAIAKALGRNPYRYMTSKIIRNLLLRKDSAVSASALLKEFAQVSDIQLLFLPLQDYNNQEYSPDCGPVSQRCKRNEAFA
ncbi:heterokaryon incompatibility domain-containing protein [Trichoderma longibrachiatum]